MYEHSSAIVGTFTCRVIGEDEGMIYDPRTNYDNMSTMLFWGSVINRFSPGDEQVRVDDFTIPCEACDGSGDSDDFAVFIKADGNRFPEVDAIAIFKGEGARVRADAFCDEQEEARPGYTYGSSEIACPVCHGDGEVTTDAGTWLAIERDAIVSMPIHVWDDWNPRYSPKPGEWEHADGAVFFTADDLLNRWGHWNGKLGAECEHSDPNETGEGEPVDWYRIIERYAVSDLRHQVLTYDAWAAGEVYRYEVEDEHGEVIDSCGGYIGDEDAAYALECAKDAAQWHVDQAEREQAEVRYWQTRDVQTVSQ